MKNKWVLKVFMVMCVVVSMCSCGKGKDPEKHAAYKMQQDGVWTERNKEYIETGETLEEIGRISVSVHKDMTEKDMMKVLDYYELIFPTYNDGALGKSIERKETVNYVIFCKDDTDEIIARYKYVNGKCEEWTEEEEGNFISPMWKKVID